MITIITGILTNIKEIVVAASVIVGIIGAAGWVNQKQKADAAINNLYSKTVQWEDKEGRLVTETTELRFTIDELKAVAAKDSTKLSETELKLKKVADEAKKLGLKLNQVQSFIGTDLSVSKTGVELEPQFAEDSVLIGLKSSPMEALDMFVDMSDSDNITMDFSYNIKLNTTLYRERRKETKKGNPRFFLARWVNPDWQYSTVVSCDDPFVGIDNVLHVDFKKK